MEKSKKIILGCMGLGGGWNQNPPTKEDEKQAQSVIEAALEVGIDTFDHADIYTFGKAEAVFGKVLKQKPELREHMHLQTKAGIMIGKGPNGGSIYNNSKEYLVNQVHKSLNNLQTDYLDTLLIHRPDALMNGYEIAETFSELKDKGLVRYFGVSNMSVSQIELIKKYWKEPLIANQIQLSLGHANVLDMGAEVNTNLHRENGLQGILEYAQMNDLTIQTWGSLDRGRFIKKDIAQGDRKVADYVQLLANQYNVDASVILLSWLFKLPLTIHPVIGTTNPERIKNSQQALELELTREEWYNLWLSVREHPLP